MEALIRAARSPDYPAAVVLVISNIADAAGLQTAAAAGIDAMTLDHRPFGKDRPAHEAALDQALRAHDVELVALAGYMRILSPRFIAAWPGRIMNIHPSLLPRHPGLHTHRRALEAGDEETGCTVHYVTEGVDEGPIIGQARVPIRPGDDEAALAARVLAEEHRLYPACLAKVAESLRRRNPMTKSLDADPPPAAQSPP